MSTPDEQAAEQVQAEIHERHERAINIVAGWALKGMQPTPEVLARIKANVNGDVTLDEAVAQAKARYAPSTARMGLSSISSFAHH